MKLKGIACVVALGAAIVTNAQEKIPYNGFETLSEKAEKFEEDGNFHEAFETLHLLNKNDSNYFNSLTSQSYYLINDEERDSTKYEMAIELLQQGIESNEVESKYYYYINKAASLSNLGKEEEALAVYDEGIKKYNKSYYFYYQKGLAYERMEKYEKAIKMYEKAIIYNPYYADTHLKLGYIAYRAGNITEALICLNVYLMLNPDGENSINVLEATNTIVSATVELENAIEVEVSEDDEAFEDIDLLINNHIALQDKYKVKNKLDIALTRQNHLLLAQLKKFKGDGGFFDKRYVPFYQWLDKSGYFDAFIYTICFSAQNEKFRKILDSKIGDIKAFMPKGLEELGDAFNEVEMKVEGKKKTMYCFYNNNLDLQAIGEMKDDKKIGYWYVYSSTKGYLTSEGNLDENEKKTGEWTWYRESGEIEEVSNYSDGQYDGLKKYYYPDGTLNFTVNYKEGELNGEYKYYNKYGALTEEKVFVDGEIDGELKTYYETGVNYPEYVVPYKAGKIHGDVARYYVTGQKRFEVTYVDGKKEGVAKEYYITGEPFSESTYKEGMMVGTYKDYYLDGSIKTEGNFEEDEREGTWKYYSRNGKLETECFYKGGKLNGEYKEYDLDGILYYMYEYRKNDVYAFTFYDKAGKILHTDDKQSGTLDYKGRHANGNSSSQGIYNLKGGKEGEWKYFDDNGLLSSTSNYKENNAEGEAIYYYPNGNKQAIKNYVNDSLDGYYQYYYANGELNYEGWYKKHNQEGVWKYYHPNKMLKEVNYFNNDRYFGEQLSYSIADDKLDTRLIYKDGRLVGEDYYGPDGKVYLHIDIPFEENATLQTHHMNKAKKIKYNYSHGIKNGPMEEFWANGQLRVRGEYLYGQRQGNWKWYYEDGTLESEYNYVYGDLVGETKDYHPNGKVKEIRHYEIGKLQGTEKDYNENGVLRGEIPYIQNKIHGKRYFYAEDGPLQMIRHYNNGEIIGYSYMDKSEKEVEMIATPNETGKVVCYFANGKKSREMNIVKGSFEGPYKSYYSTGQIYQDQVYKNDEREGEVKTYYVDGTIKKVENYTQGYLNGKVKEYYKNGKLKKETDYIYNVKHGKVVEYNEDGSKKREQEFFNDTEVL